MATGKERVHLVQGGFFLGAELLRPKFDVDPLDLAREREGRRCLRHGRVRGRRGNDRGHGFGFDGEGNPVNTIVSSHNTKAGWTVGGGIEGRLASRTFPRNRISLSCS
jgi:hypothetical protein